MGEGNKRNKLCYCNSGKKYKNCCIYKPIEPLLTGDKAEAFIDYLSKKTFLKPWVFKNPMCLDSDEFSDVAILFRDTIILIEVKGNKFDPKNPQRYLKSAKERHRQLLRAKGIVERHSKKVHFKNNYFEFETEFREIKKIYLISVSTGPGEMEIASGAEHIDYEKLDYKEISKYLGFYDSGTGIHSFTADEFKYASIHIDTLKDFFWYLDFEKKFLSNQFTKKEGRSVIAVVDTHREDMIAIYVLNYYWDDELNTTGNINLDKILGIHNEKLEKSDMIMYAGTDTRNYLEDDERYIAIKKEKEISYGWDYMVNDLLSQYETAYKIVGGDRKDIASVKDMNSILEELSFTSRLERVMFSEKIKEAHKSGFNVRNMMSKAEGSHTLLSYVEIKHETFPSKEQQEHINYKHLYTAWCRIKFAEGLEPVRHKVKKVLLMTRHSFKNISSYTFALSDEIMVDEKKCKDVGVI